MASKYNCWELIEATLPYSRRTLLHGMPGTGKTYIGEYHGLKPEQEVYSIYITEYTPVSEPRGNIYPVVRSKERVYEWQDGPATKAFRTGGRLIINEIDKASDDCITFFLALLDDIAVSRLTLPTGEVVMPHPDFTVVATMNAKPMALIDPLRDRFPVTVHVDRVNPYAFLTIPEDVRDIAKTTSQDPIPENRVGIRAWQEFAILREQGMVEEMAAHACFGDLATKVWQILVTKRAATNFDPSRTPVKV